MPLALEGGSGSNGMAFLFTVMPTDSSSVCTSFPVTPLDVRFNQHEVVIGSTGHYAVLLRQSLCQHLGILQHLLLVDDELR